mgnify:FL=1
MSNPATAELLIGRFAHFISKGTVIALGDGDASLTVGPFDKPDITPTDNWLAYSLGPVLSAMPGTDTEDQGYSAPSLRGWVKVPKTVVKADFIDFKTRKMTEEQLRLQYGLSDKIVHGTAQRIFTTSIRRLEGWLKVHDFDEESRTFLSVFDVYGYLELKKGYTADGKPAEPEFRITVIPDVDGVEIEGNVIVFPTPA